MHKFDLTFEVLVVPAQDPRFRVGAVLSFPEAVEFFELNAADHLARAYHAELWECDDYVFRICNKRRQQH